MNKLVVEMIASKAMEYVRPVGICVLIFASKYFGGTPAEEFTFIGPGLVILMCGTISFEGLFLGAVGSEKLGYTPNREYQRQCALYSLAIALTAVLALIFKWGTHAYVTVTSTMLLFFLFSGANHLFTALKAGNKSKTNFLRPILSAILIIWLVPVILKVLK